MLLRCVREFTTRETGVPFTIMEGTVWYKASFDVQRGGYEDVVLEQMDGAMFTGIIAKVRLERVNEYFEPVPLHECPEPIGRCTCGMCPHKGY